MEDWSKIFYTTTFNLYKIETIIVDSKHEEGFHYDVAITLDHQLGDLYGGINQ
jgi:hypothetical protein